MNALMLNYQRYVAFSALSAYLDGMPKPGGGSSATPDDPASTLSRREREILDIVYRLGRATAADVRAAMAQPPTDPAVRATLRILERKGRLRHEYDGPRYVYTPTVARDDARRSAFRHLIDTFFGGSARGAVATLLDMEDLDMPARERRRLRELVDAAEKRGK
jgi:BlaI family transcriptional regulator, penicillinase repressor